MGKRIEGDICELAFSDSPIDGIVLMLALANGKIHIVNDE